MEHGESINLPRDEHLTYVLLELQAELGGGGEVALFHRFPDRYQRGCEPFLGRRMPASQKILHELTVGRVCKLLVSYHDLIA